MAEKRPALGRGLSALIPDVAIAAPSDKPFEVDTDLLRPNPFQPRAHVDDTRLDELTRSIRANGIIQPVIVRRTGDRYEIIAGERRWRAAQRAGLLRGNVTQHLGELACGEFARSTGAGGVLRQSLHEG